MPPIMTIYVNCFLPSSQHITFCMSHTTKKADVKRNMNFFNKENTITQEILNCNGNDPGPFCHLLGNLSHKCGMFSLSWL